MRKRLPMSALITGLLAAPVLGGAAAPAMAESRAPLVEASRTSTAAVFPAEMPIEVGERMKRWARGERPDAYGMRMLQRRMFEQVQARMSRVLAGALEPALPAASSSQGGMYPVQFMQADQVVVNAPKEKAAFLGVNTSPADATLRAQLSLARGTGLVVDFVEKDSPADAAGLKVRDVLQKLDDQLLVNAEQLRVLVRVKKPGDSVILTVVRGGKVGTFTAKLTEKELPVLEQMPVQSPHTPMGNAADFSPGPGMPGTVTQHMAGTSVTVHSDGSMTRRMTDEQNDITLNKTADGKETALVKDREGHQLYEGTLAGLEKANLSADVQKKTRELEQISNQVKIHLGGAGAGGGGTGAAVAANTYSLSRDDTEHSITLRIDGNGRRVTVKELVGGHVIYEGTGSEEELKSLTPAVAEKVKALLAKAK